MCSLELDLSDEKRKASFWIESDLITELEREFRDSIKGALRKTIRLGALTIKPEAVKIREPSGLEHQLLSINMSELKDERARGAYNRLAQIQ